MKSGSTHRSGMLPARIFTGIEIDSDVALRSYLPRYLINPRIVVSPIYSQRREGTRILSALLECFLQLKSRLLSCYSMGNYAL